MKQVLILFFLLANTYLFAQTSYDSSFRFYYYDQKLSMFETMPDQKNEIVWLGDSITDGGEWSELFPGIKTLNRGVSSDNTFGILNRLYEVIRRKPAKIFLLIGINDIARNIPDSVILRNYKKIVDSLQQQTPQTKLYVQSILPTNNEFTTFKNHQNKTEHILFLNEALKKICAEKKINFVDLYNNFINAEGKMDKRFTNDGLHLTGEGYQQWKAVLKKNKLL
jgi:lysophospholipase L1-like esterase